MSGMTRRRPFEGHIDAWLQMADTEAQQEAQIAHYRDVFNQMDLNSDGELDEHELQREMDNLQAQRRVRCHGPCPSINALCIDGRSGL